MFNTNNFISKEERVTFVVLNTDFLMMADCHELDVTVVVEFGFLNLVIVRPGRVRKKL